MSTIQEKLQSSKDGLDALLTYANGVTGQTDSNIGDAVKTLCDGYGHGGATTVYDLLSNAMKNAGFIEIEFEPGIPVSGNYFRVYHSLGKKPTDAVFFSQDLSYYSSDYYRVGCCVNDNFGKDNNYNRTYHMSTTQYPTYESDLNYLLMSIGMYPLASTRTAWNATLGCTDEYIELRNQQNNTVNTTMMPGKWKLYLR